MKKISVQDDYYVIEMSFVVVLQCFTQRMVAFRNKVPGT